MKRVVVLSVILLFVVIGYVNAKNPPAVAAKLPNQLKSAIAKNLEYPSQVLKMNLEGDVWMKICVDKKSKVEIVDLSATNQKLGTYVKKELSSIYVNNPGCEVGQVYYLKVKFDLKMHN